MKLDIFDLKNLTYIPSNRACDAFIEAALVCFDNQHKANLSIKIDGDIKNEINFKSESITQRIKDNWKDLVEATEYGATGIAIWTIIKFTDYKVVQRSPRKTGFDYYLDNKDSAYPFQNRAKLEVSGILKGSKAQLEQRLREKIKQIKRFETKTLPYYVVVVKFDEPIVKILYYE